MQSSKHTYQQMKSLLINIGFFFFLSGVFAQRPEIAISYTARNNENYQPFDSIQIKNLDLYNSSDTTLYYPDTVLVLEYMTGIQDKLSEAGFQLKQNFPNPIKDRTTIELVLPQHGNLKILITDLMGRNQLTFKNTLESGTHSFIFEPGNQSFYIMTAIFGSNIRIIKMINNNIYFNDKCKLQHTGFSPERKIVRDKSISQDEKFKFMIENHLRYICYADSLQSGIVHQPLFNTLITFEFAANIPCPDQPAVVYEGKTYETIQIYGQCWLNENLDIGTMINGQEDQTDNDILEKYCYGNDSSNCNDFGGMYQWGEMMNYINTEGSQGICPDGWHIPTDDEWRILEGSVDSLYTITDTIWNQEEYRGYDAGKRLKATSGWDMNGNGTNMFGFDALAAGTRSNFGDFILQGRNAPFWSSSRRTYTQVWYRVLTTSNLVYRFSFDKDSGFAVRCIKDVE